MPPKKKNNKKGADDWDAELGESVTATPPAEAKDDEEAGEDEFPAGGLMAAMKKNRNKKKAKGKSADEFEGDVDGATTPANEDPALDLSVKAPEEANLDDEFVLPDKKSKAKGAGKQVKEEPEEDDGEEERGADGRVMTKKEKEKAKKEREKQRKKEQVRNLGIIYYVDIMLIWLFYRPQRRRPPHQLQRLSKRQILSPKRKPRHQNQLLLVKARS
jgi:translation initiation factor 5B